MAAPAGIYSRRQRGLCIGRSSVDALGAFILWVKAPLTNALLAEVLNIIRMRLLTQSKRCPLQFPKHRPGLGGTAYRFRALLLEAQR